MTADTEHEIFRQPENPNGKVWRYMDFTKYVSLLESSALWFGRADQLGDPFEGAWTAESDRRFETMFQPGPNTEAAIQKTRLWHSEGRKTFRENSFVNCWHMADHESAAMWRLYSSSSEAIAIQSTYAKLADVLPHEVLLGMVEYIDYDTFAFKIGNVLAPLARKRLSYTHEREVRALKLVFRGEDSAAIPLGIGVSIDLSKLIECVFVSPSAASWLQPLVQSVSSRFGYDFSVAPSRLSERPLF